MSKERSFLINFKYLCALIFNRSMALSPLLKHVYSNGSEEVIRRGKKIFLTKGVELTNHSNTEKRIDFKVKNDVFNYFYRVTVSRYDQPDKMNVRCQCPYNMGVICRHEVAALMELNDMVQSGFFNDSEIEFNQIETHIRMKNIELNTLRMLSSNYHFDMANNMAKKNVVKITAGKNEEVSGYIKDNNQKFEMTLKREDGHIFRTSCQCEEKKSPVCIHKITFFLQILNNFGSLYFDTIKDPNKLKNKLLGVYGFSIDSPNWEDKFEFLEENGKIFLKVLDPTIKKINSIPSHIIAPSISSAQIDTKKTIKEKIKTENFGIGVCVVTDVPYFPYFNIQVISGQLNSEGTKIVDQVDIVNLYNRAIETTYTSREEKNILRQAQKLSEKNILNYIKQNISFSNFIDMNDFESMFRSLDENDLKELIKEYLTPKISEFFKEINKSIVSTYQMVYGEKLSVKNLKLLILNDQPITAELTVSLKSNKINAEILLSNDEKKIAYNKKILSKIVYFNNNEAYLINQKHIEPSVLEVFPQSLTFKQWIPFSFNTLKNLEGILPIKIDPALVQEINEKDIQYGVEFKDNETTLIFRPYFIYDGHECKWNNYEYLQVYSESEGIVKIRRDKISENKFIEGLRQLHYNYVSVQQPHFSIRQKDVLKKSWFFKLYDYLTSNNTIIEGLGELEGYKISTHKPQTQISITSGTDWFDTKIEVVYGDEAVDIKKIKRALLKGDSFVKLKDGSIGMLPEEWLEKYAMIVKMGESGDNNSIKLNKINFALLEDIKDDIDDYDIIEELEEKKKNLLEYKFDDVHRQLDIPNMENAILRPYQEEGFYWLSYLAKVKWGGILADDMGLGKTLQTLTLLKYYFHENPTAKVLIVAPTSLMFNWQNEIIKFTPAFNYTNHHGPSRESNIKKLTDQYNIILTTYGTLRSDVLKFEAVEFDYVVLDESQMIKNPMAQISKSVRMLNSKNRLCLSGTPLQNNTFDIFAQMHFLNPGMLGSIEFFKNEIANPIDKMQDQTAKAHLHKILYPFILRRTKEQVAPDLPPKTESILWCDMNENQRKIYNEYREFYRNQIVSEIDQKGIGKSKFTILQGLTKLRQICDSPSILPEKVDFKEQSIKIENLTDQIEQIKDNHKALVFSQFIGMLGLIKKELEKRNIPYAYFDGSTSTIDRQKMIDNFQKDDKCRVFLISLKAGGVGLNLTSADYVYLVDPWWNPAIEQQAIDRTHRIGQTKNIFAYRMVCKDTIEEKILALQDKKKSLVKEIIGDESSFVKNLTEKDILYLFS